MAEVLEETLHRPCRSVAERTNRVAFNLVGDVDELVEIFLLPSRRQ